MITREFNLYLHAGHSIPLVINVNQYDHGEQWLFTLFNSDGTQYVPSSGAIVGIKSDNLGIINTGSVDSQGRVVINETQQMTAAVGKAVFELVIDDGAHGTANFVVLVEPKPGDNADLSETDISMIEQAIEAASTIKPYGSPLVASTVAGMTDHEKVYVYVGSETGYTSGNWYYWDGSAWTSGGVYNSVAVQTDTTLTLSGVAADSKKVGDEISDLKSQIQHGGSFNAEVKSALDAFTASVLQLAEKVAYIDGNGQDYYDDIEDAADALHSAMYPPVNLSSISAVYTQSSTVYTNDSLDSLKTDLVITAHYSDSTTAVVTNYTLSGTLVEGTSTITATYGDKTTTFNVTVTAQRTVSVESGAINYNNGNEEANVKRARTDYIPATNNVFKVSAYANSNSTNTVSYAIRYYDANHTFIGTSDAHDTVPTATNSGHYLVNSWLAGDGTEYTDNSTLTGVVAYIRLVFRDTSESTITDMSGTVIIDGTEYRIVYE